MIWVALSSINRPPNATAGTTFSRRLRLPPDEPGAGDFSGARPAPPLARIVLAMFTATSHIPSGWCICNPPVMRVFSRIPLALLCFGFLPLCAVSDADAGRVLNGLVPRAAQELLPTSDVAEREQLNLAIGLPVRDPAALAAFVKEVSDPSSANFRHYLTPDQFTARFGPTAEEYDAVIRFAEAKGLTVTATHPNRLLVDVSGSVGDVQRAFHVRLHNFSHPTESRTFFAPDTDPVVDAPVPIIQVTGLTNYWLPRPRSRIRSLNQ